VRELGKASSSGGMNKEQKVKAATEKYLEKARLLSRKLTKEMPGFPLNDEGDLKLIIVLEHFAALMEKHIDLVERRIIKGEQIPHEEKLFSVFETYTEWIKKGKIRPSVELGKKFAITTDQFDLIVDYRVMHNEQDRDIVIKVADRLLNLYDIASWSFDKGYWGKENKHSAIESNINELEHRGLDRCPDRGYPHFKNYLSLGVCACNLKKIGAKLLEQERERLRAQGLLRKAA